MNTEELSQLIRMAQVLKIRCNMLYGELKRTNNDAQATAVREAHQDANNCESRLIRIQESEEASP